MADFGFIVLVVAFVASVYSIVVSTLGASRRDEALVDSGRKSLLAVFVLVSLAEAILAYALVAHNFQIEYVASYTSRELSIPYLISGLWAGNAGSLLFWAWLLSLSGAVFVLRKPVERKELLPYTSAIIMFTQAFFLIMLILAKNPFDKLPYTPPDGVGLNPLLENPAMIIHPPFLLAGYVVFTVPFALAVAALLTKKLDNGWITRARGWALLAWLLLGAGNIIGAWWAYVELGWGGYWAWDPVENAGLMPWLTGTAFLHSITMQRRRGMFKRWSIALIIITFILTIFGTFLTRSNILSSVHTFGETTLGPFFLTFLFITFFGSLALLFYRQGELEGEAGVEAFVSKEGTFLVNNLLWVGATLVIFVGTMFPAIAEAISGVKAEVGKSFFNMVDVPILMTVVFLAGVCVIIGWRQPATKEFKRHLLWAIVVAIILLVVLPISGVRVWSAAIAFSVCGFVISATLSQWARELIARRRVKAENPQAKTSFGFMWANKNRYGAYLVHLAIVVMAIGIIGSSAFSVEEEAVLKLGQSMSIKQYTLTYDQLTFSGSEDKMVITASMSVYNQGELIGKLTPEKYIHRSFEQPVTEVAIRSTPAEDLYVILAEWDRTRTAAFRVLVNPLVMWIWVGGGIFFIGGLICFLPQKVRTEELKKGKPKRAR